MADTTSTTSVLTGRLGLAAAVSAIAAVLYGYDTGIISGALLQIDGRVRHRQRLEAGHRREHPARRGHRRARVQPRSPRRAAGSGTILIIAAIFVVGAIALRARAGQR